MNMLISTRSPVRPSIEIQIAANELNLFLRWFMVRRRREVRYLDGRYILLRDLVAKGRTVLANCIFKRAIIGHAGATVPGPLHLVGTFQNENCFSKARSKGAMSRPSCTL